jgi:hypothetical protein
MIRKQREEKVAGAMKANRLVISYAPNKNWKKN